MLTIADGFLGGISVGLLRPSNAGLLLLVTSCSHLKLAPPPTAAESTALEQRSRIEHGLAEVQFTTRERADVVKTKIASAFLDEGLSVTSTQEQLIEARPPANRDAGTRGVVVARALIMPGPTGEGARVRMYGERTASGFAGEKGQRIAGRTYGEGGAMWLSFLKIAARLQPDSTQRTVVLP
jgi:hypothetical protein